VLIAYNITVRQLSGATPLLSERYDIVAKAGHPARPDEMLRMLRALLEDRFKLVVRRETREAPVYVLTVAKGDPKLQPASVSERLGPSPRTPAHAGGSELASGHLVFRDESMADFAWALSRTGGLGDRVVVDQTGLTETYDFELMFARESAPHGADPREATAVLENPSIFAALQEQLGLKLESRKAPVEFLIVEHVERPTEN